MPHVAVERDARQARTPHRPARPSPVRLFFVHHSASHSAGGSSAGAVGGAVAGVLVALLVAAVLIVVMRRRRATRASKTSANQLMSAPGACIDRAVMDSQHAATMSGTALGPGEVLRQCVAITQPLGTTSSCDVLLGTLTVSDHRSMIEA